tara:strand:- start:719 stop:1273 length:555 start_codon:yes stop_codon:yes gene_type:complete
MSSAQEFQTKEKQGISVWSMGPVRISPHWESTGIKFLEEPGEFEDGDYAGKHNMDRLEEIAKKLVTHLGNNGNDSKDFKISRNHCFEVDGEWCIIISYKGPNINNIRDYRGKKRESITYYYMIRTDDVYKKIYGCPFINTEYISDLGYAPLTSKALPKLYADIEKYFVENYGAELIKYFPTHDV